MFKCYKKTTTFNKKIWSLTDVAINEVKNSTNIFNLIKMHETLMIEKDNQIRYKRNKEFLYTNCNKIKRRFYHYRDESNFPRITVCVLYNEQENLACRGISICSFLDSPVKEDGRDISEDRAINAYQTLQDTEPIIKDDADIIILEIEKLTKPENLIDFGYKSKYNIILSKFEKRLFNIQE